MILEKKHDINFSGNFMRNTGMNILSLIVNVLVGLLLVPYFLDTLGPASYALIPLATSVTSYVTLIIDVLNAATSRYLTIELQRGEIQKANETYSTAYTLLLGSVLILFPIGVIISIFAPNLFETGDITHSETTIFFILIITSILITTLRSNFMAVLFSYNRLDLRNWITIIATLSQVGLIILLFNINKISLINVGIAYCIASILSLIIAYVFAKRQTHSLHYSFKNCRKKEGVELAKLSAFLLLDTFGCILQSQVALIIVNIYFGVIAQTEYSLVLTLVAFLGSLAGIVTTTFSPKIYSIIGMNKVSDAHRFTSFATKITGLGLALPIAILCIFASQFMTLWVGEEYAFLSMLILLIIPFRYFNTVIGCQIPLAIAQNKMKFPAFGNIIAGIVEIGMALSFPIIFNIGYYGVALALIVRTCLFQALALPIYYSKITGGKCTDFIFKEIPGILAMLGLLVTGWLITTVANMVGIDINSVAFVIITALLISGIYLLLLWILILSTNEQMLILECLPKWSRKYLRCFSLRDKL